MIAWIFSEGQIERLFWARPVSSAVVLSAFVAVILLTIFLYCRRQGLPTWVRVSLALTRLLALALIVAVLFEPTATIKQTHTEKRRLPVPILSLIHIQRSRRPTLSKYRWAPLP